MADDATAQHVGAVADAATAVIRRGGGHAPVFQVLQARDAGLLPAHARIVEHHGVNSAPGGAISRIAAAMGSRDHDPADIRVAKLGNAVEHSCVDAFCVFHIMDFCFVRLPAMCACVRR
ncbi:hypothetical protein D3C77_601270 [compost metagenome]